MNQDFNNSKEIGDQAERAVFKYLRDHCKYQPVRMVEDLELQKKGIDIIAGGKSFEVKYDKKQAETGNYFLELETKGGQGWLFTCQADFICIVSAKHEMLVTKPTHLRRVYEEAEDVRTAKTNQDYWAIGAIVPSSTLFRLLNKQFTLRDIRHCFS